MSCSTCAHIKLFTSRVRQLNESADAPMTPFDLLFIVCFLMTVGALIRAGYLLLRKRAAAAKQTATRLAVFIAIYAATLVVVSLVTPQKKLRAGDVRCFDEWCITVVSATRHP